MLQIADATFKERMQAPKFAHFSLQSHSFESHHKQLRNVLFAHPFRLRKQLFDISVPATADIQRLLLWIYAFDVCSCSGPMQIVHPFDGARHNFQTASASSCTFLTHTHTQTQKDRSGWDLTRWPPEKQTARSDSQATNSSMIFEGLVTGEECYCPEDETVTKKDCLYYTCWKISVKEMHFLSWEWSPPLVSNGWWTLWEK